MTTLHDLVQAALARLPIDDPLRNFAAFDTETFYRTKKAADRLNKARKKSGLPALVPVSVDELGNWGYTHHPEWNCYLVTVFAPAYLDKPEIRYAGPPSGVPWAALIGRFGLAHNKGFDRHVYFRLVELGLAPAGLFPIWHDTADLAPYVHLPRALDKVMKIRFGHALDKAARADMDGRQFSDLNEEEAERMVAYALDDSLACWLFWAEESHNWPEHERELSVHTSEIEVRGIPADVERIEKNIAVLETAKWATRNRIPWVDTEDEDTGKPFALRSRKALDIECFKAGVPAPESTNSKSKDFLDWLDEYGAKVPAIYELSRYRRIDRALSAYRALAARVRPDGRAALALKYMGADKTGRWSGGSKFNPQNQAKSPLYFTADYGWADEPVEGGHTVDMRSCLTASPGNKLFIADLSQIEPRILNWIVRNKVFLDACRRGLSPYEAHAEASGFKWTGKMKATMPGMYALFKARLLALGYAGGWMKFIEMARGYCKNEAQFLSIFGVVPAEDMVKAFLDYLEYLSAELNHAQSKKALKLWPTLDAETRNIWVNSWIQVTDFRATNPAIASRKGGLWDNLDRAFKDSVKDGIYELELPSGRVLKYFGVTPEYGWSARPGNPMAKPSRVYGGLLTENLVQATARDCFGHGILTLEKAGFKVLFHVHDEVIVDAPADTDPNLIRKLLCTIPDWCKDLPVDSECEVSSHYKK